MQNVVLALAEIDRTKLALAGGKGANLGELSRIEGVRVPDGVCISTAAFARIAAEMPAVREGLARLSHLAPNERGSIAEVSRALRSAIEEAIIPADIQEAIFRALADRGPTPYAVRSSATAEDLPTASFAGQYDTYLNVVGEQEILRHVARCWASLFSDRAVAYRIQNGFDHTKIRLAVILEAMVAADTAGVLFTADPVTGNRKVSTIEASFGLGEALVAGRVNADNYRVRSGTIVDKKIGTKTLAVRPRPHGHGGMEDEAVDSRRRTAQTLTDEQILQLERVGRTIESHFGCPQDIEWCFERGTLYIVQSRPITTLFPIPEAADRANRVYVSVGHQQMMTDPMKPLGLSMFQLNAARPMFAAGGRLFVDVTSGLASPAGRANLLEVAGHGDPLVRDALVTLIERGDFVETRPRGAEPPAIRSHHGQSAAEIAAPVEGDPGIVRRLIERSESALAELRRNMETKSGTDVFDFIREDVQAGKMLLWDPKNLAAILAGINASAWINETMKEWLGEKNAADTLAQSLPDNVTSQMGLELLDVADAIRPLPEVVAYLQRRNDDGFLDGLVDLEGGAAARGAIQAFLDKYGMRCAGEIDITRPRWSETPSALLPLILGHVKAFRAGEAKRRFEKGKREAEEKERELLERLRDLPDGDQKAAETKEMIGLIRGFMGYREYPKYAMMNRYFVYRQALMKEAEALARAGVVEAKDDVAYLTFDELRDVVANRRAAPELIARRKAEHASFQKLAPPRVLTSDGETVSGSYAHESLPAGAIAGLAVSSGVVEGRARVLRRMEDAAIEEGDILVTLFTDPSWTPLFVSIQGLVTEVGGLMTHGAVIAREYGLPAVVGVERATERIADGQRIRVNGTDGWVQVLG